MPPVPLNLRLPRVFPPSLIHITYHLPSLLPQKSTLQDAALKKFPSTIWRNCGDAISSVCVWSWCPRFFEIFFFQNIRRKRCTWNTAKTGAAKGWQLTWWSGDWTHGKNLISIFGYFPFKFLNLLGYAGRYGTVGTPFASRSSSSSPRHICSWEKNGQTQLAHQDPEHFLESENYLPPKKKQKALGPWKPHMKRFTLSAVCPAWFQGPFQKHGRSTQW